MILEKAKHSVVQYDWENLGCIYQKDHFVTGFEASRNVQEKSWIIEHFFVV